MTQEKSTTLEFSIHLRKGRNGRQQLLMGNVPETPDVPAGRIPRITKLIALAIKMDGMIQRGEVKDYAELAVLGHVSRARITQIMNLLQLAPDIQEEILTIVPVIKGPDHIKTRLVLQLAGDWDWRTQRRTWGQLVENNIRTEEIASQLRPPNPESGC